MDVVSTAMRTVVITLLAALTAAGCQGTPAEPTRSAVSFSHTFESPEALARAVLAAVQTGDVDRLSALQLSEAEFREYVWPELDTSRPERNIPFDYAWGQMKQRSDGALSGTVARYRGQPLRLVRAGFTGKSTRYTTFAVMRESEIVAADAAGRELVLRLYGSAMVKDGRYKLFSYVVD